MFLLMADAWVSIESCRDPRMCLLWHVAGLADQLKVAVEELPEQMIMKIANNSDHQNERRGLHQQ